MIRLMLVLFIMTSIIIWLGYELQKPFLMLSGIILWSILIITGWSLVSTILKKE